MQVSHTSFMTKDSASADWSHSTAAVYKGQNVAVYSADKSEISLNRQDLVDLINVRIQPFFV